MQAPKIEDRIEKWKEQPKKIARQMIGLYGQPDEITEKRLLNLLSECRWR